MDRALIEIADHAGTRLAPWLAKQIRSTLRIIGRSDLRLSIALVDSRAMSALHWRFMRVRGPTDVLTFELERSRKNRVSAGEIVICAPFARRQATRRGHSFRGEVLLYGIHGVLHLCGHNDKTRVGFDRIHRLEDAILTRLGVGPVFNPAAKSARDRRTVSLLSTRL